MKLPFDPDFPKPDEDLPYLDQLKDIPVRPIFIMGLHRSGTTFLYDSVAHCFPVANLTLYHIFYYHRLLKNKIHGTEQRDRDTLNRLFQALGIKDRKIDNVLVKDDTVEEYGWLLRQVSYNISIQESNRERFEEICKKLLYIHPGAESVLLKNPWDTGNAEQILKWFPQARFIYITREPIYILNSLVNAVHALGTGKQPFQTLLVDDFKMPGGKITINAIYGFWKFLRALRLIAGYNLSTYVAIRPIAAQLVKKDLAAYYREVHQLPKESVYEVNYQEFNRNPQRILNELKDFLGLPFQADPADIVPKPRTTKLNKPLQSYESRFKRMVERKLKRAF
jgi:hypothetical protein